MMPQTIGRYEVRSKLGQGGMASVYHAYDPRFEREVAIKVLPREFMDDSVSRERFDREAKTVAALQHPSIVQVYDFGEQEGQPYLVMQLMLGGSLADLLEVRPLALAEATTIINRIAAGVDAAHDIGVIHRDLKPANILFDKYGNAFISDFGIVKLTETSTGLTTDVLGTPAYMSPEQINEVELDGRCDIYALGVILYEMLAGATPFQADTSIKIALMHLSEPPPDIREVRPELPRGCSQIISRAMAKDPNDRFRTASQLADALVKVNTSPPSTLIERPRTAPETLVGPHGRETRKDPVDPLTEAITSSQMAVSVRQHRRKRTGLAWVWWLLAGISLIVAAAAVLGVVYLLGRETPAVTVSPAGETVAEVEETTEPSPTVNLTPATEPTSPPPTPITVPEAEVEVAVETEAEDEAPAAAPDVITAANSGQVIQGRVLRGHNKDVYSLAWSPNSNLLASGSEDTRAVIWDVATGARLHTLEGHNDTINAMAFSPDGDRLVTGSKDSLLRIWDAVSGGQLHLLRAHGAAVSDVDWSPDGSLIASGSVDGQLIIWDATTGERLGIYLEHYGGIQSVAFSPDGTRLATGSEDWDILIWDVATMTPLYRMEEDLGAVVSLDFTQDGTRLASSVSWLALIWEFDGSSQATWQLKGHQKEVLDVAWSKDGSMLVTASLDDRLLMWDAQTGESLGALTPDYNTLRLLSVAFSPDGRYIASGAGDGSIILWELGE
jgi:serine/threonine protein kinase/WD40 repeat protein